jgi:hypothetical protein
MGPAMQLECFPLTNRPPELVPGRSQRGWMERFEDRHAYRCLPLTMANTSGWEVLCPMGFEAAWNGGKMQEDIMLIPDQNHPDFHEFVSSHFSHGIITFHVGYMFRTPPGWSMWCGGPPNHIKDGVQPLSGLVETDWLPFPFTMNWHFTRPGKVRFEKGEPFCFITLVEDKKLESFDVVIKSLEADADLHGQYEAWAQRRHQFNERLFRKDPETTKAAWQRYYFRGEPPRETDPKPEDHVNKRRLAAPRRMR